MTLIVGLGNPGRRYAATRHNLGFLVLDALAQRLGLTWVERERPKIALASSAGLLLAKPRTFMNDSGIPIAALARSRRIAPTSTWVVLDDLDLPFGTVRVRPSGSAGGHRGLASVIEHLGTTAFPRLRLGIGSNRDAGLPAEEYVLQPFTGDERATLPDVISRAITALEQALGTTLNV